MDNDIHYMTMAINEATQGISSRHGGPFGAVIIEGNTILGSAHNTVLRDHDPTCHAEVNAIRQAALKKRNHNLVGCTIYTTAEPCAMCYGALQWAGITTICFGLTNEEIQALGFTEMGILTKNKKIFNKLAIKKGLLHEECLATVKLWKESNPELY